MSALKRPLCNYVSTFFLTWNWVYKHSSCSGQLIYIVGFLNYLNYFFYADFYDYYFVFAFAVFKYLIRDIVLFMESFHII